MSTSATIIAALRYEGGIVIGADSQASDLNARVRWPVEKLDKVGAHPIVLGFSGSVGTAERARAALAGVTLHPNMFRKRDHIRDAIDRCLAPVYQRIKASNPTPGPTPWDITIWGLVTYWAEDSPHILELELDGESSFHDYFHAVGSGANTAYAIWRTLGGRRLAGLGEPKSIHVMLRILRTCVDVEVWGVNDPLSLWLVAEGRARKLPPDEINAQLQYVGEWEERERKAFLDS